MSSLFGIRKLKEDLVEAIKSSAARLLAEKKKQSQSVISLDSLFTKQNIYILFSLVGFIMFTYMSYYP